MTKKYSGKDDPHDHLEKWTKARGMELQPEWVHIFCHALDTIPMNWYLETKLRHSTAEWDILKEGFLLTFSFEDGFESTDKAMQEIKVDIFKTPKESGEWTQPNWSTQLHHALECYNVTTEEEDDPWNITIPETKGQRDVKGLKVVNPDI